MQKIVLITIGTDGTSGLDAANRDLQAGWRVERIAPMGGGGASRGFAVAAVLEREDQSAAAVLEQIEQIEEEEAAEGDGAGLAVGDVVIKPRVEGEDA
jgi:hypothetical protein